MYIEVTTLSEMLLVLDRLDRQDSCSALLWEASAVFSFLSRAPSCVRALCSAAGLKREENVVELGSAAGIPWLESGG